ncbi:hypothetical protein C5S53_04705 [Methanophagales archaeon]|nr:hypothetical protein C5S53_04705 [Methanophagales archaeon]
MSKEEGAPFSLLAFYPYLPAMRFYHLPADRQIPTRTRFIIIINLPPASAPMFPAPP